jgi:hypothetical protein
MPASYRLHFEDKDTLQSMCMCIDENGGHALNRKGSFEQSVLEALLEEAGMLTIGRKERLHLRIWTCSH